MILIKLKDGNFCTTASWRFKEFISKKEYLRIYRLVDSEGSQFRYNYEKQMIKLSDIEDWKETGRPEDFITKNANKVWDILKGSHNKDKEKKK